MTYRDEFDEPQRGKTGFLGRVGPKAAFFVVLIALSFMIGVVWKLYVGAGDSNGQNVPIVRADANPFKVIPDDPGGMNIPHKDSTIFSSLKTLGEDSDSKIENLLAEDDNEEPMPHSQLFAGLNTERNPNIDRVNQASPLDKSVGDVAQKIGDTIETAPAAVKKIAESAPEEVIKIVPKVEIPEAVVPVKAPEKVKPVLEAVSKPKLAEKLAPKAIYTPDPVIVSPSVSTPKSSPASAPKVSDTSVTSSGGYYVQLGSVRSAEGAEGEWKKIVGKYKSQLSSYSHRVEKADLGAKGVFYRIQAGPVSKDKAVATCASIKKVTPGGCLVKKK